MRTEHPCNICKHDDCPYDCVWNIFYTKKYECTEYNCFLNYESSCNGDFYDVCQLCTDLTEEEDGESEVDDEQMG